MYKRQPWKKVTNCIQRNIQFLTQNILLDYDTNIPGVCTQYLEDSRNMERFRYDIQRANLARTQYVKLQ